jgi:hypothetical protein
MRDSSHRRQPDGVVVGAVVDGAEVDGAAEVGVGVGAEVDGDGVGVGAEVGVGVGVGVGAEVDGDGDGDEDDAEGDAEAEAEAEGEADAECEAEEDADGEDLADAGDDLAAPGEAERLGETVAAGSVTKREGTMEFAVGAYGANDDTGEDRDGAAVEPPASACTELADPVGPVVGDCLPAADGALPWLEL